MENVLWIVSFGMLGVRDSPFHIESLNTFTSVPRPCRRYNVRAESQILATQMWSP